MSFVYLCETGTGQRLFLKVVIYLLQWHAELLFNDALDRFERGARGLHAHGLESIEIFLRKKHV